MVQLNEPWYSNKDLFEMVEGLKTTMNELNTEMQNTKTLIRDYNGLRETLTDVNKRLSNLESGKENSRDYIGWGFAGIMAIFALINYIN